MTVKKSMVPVGLEPSASFRIGSNDEVEVMTLAETQVVGERASREAMRRALTANGHCIERL